MNILDQNRIKKSTPVQLEIPTTEVSYTSRLVPSAPAHLSHGRGKCTARFAKLARYVSSQVDDRIAKVHVLMAFVVGTLHSKTLKPLYGPVYHVNATSRQAAFDAVRVMGCSSLWTLYEISREPLL